ncbi:unnamed protein product [Miscanthus lutarioriparius]|uniref:DC1 domain-containing protein n=1 Tax=Miscanthus lutarioriparius TaxID=422564 RepID=A0A811QAC6_9POAL|nr:unnamed protein product [Miscanthus lutarioriparius]
MSTYQPATFFHKCDDQRAYFAHDPAHRLLPGATDSNDGDEFTCGGCLVAGAGPRYRCAHPGCGFTIHEACAPRRFPRTLKSAVHPQHRLRRREAATGEGEGAACGVAVHPLCARMPASARGPAHPGGGHEAWLVRVASPPATAPELDGDGEPKQGKHAAASAGCEACGRPLGAWRYRSPAVPGAGRRRSSAAAQERERATAGARSPWRGAAAAGCCLTSRAGHRTQLPWLLQWLTHPCMYVRRDVCSYCIRMREV